MPALDPFLAAELGGEDDKVCDEPVEVEPAVELGADQGGLDLVKGESLVRVGTEERLDLVLTGLAALELVGCDGQGDHSGIPCPGDAFMVSVHSSQPAAGSLPGGTSWPANCRSPAPITTITGSVQFF